MGDGRGYLLPDEPYTDVLRWFLVAVPDKPEYVRAATGAYTQFTKWWTWEKTGDTKGAQAADAWDEAVDATLEALEMGFPDTLLAYIDEVETLLAALQKIQSAGAPCCENLAPTNQQETTTNDETNVPATWGDGEAVADLDDFEQLKCGAGHAYVDHLKGMADEMDAIVEAGAIAVGAIAAILGLLSGAGIILAISYGTAAGVVGALVAGASQATFGTTAADIEAVRADLVCALVQQDAAGVRDILSAELGAAWTLFYQYVDYDSAIAVIANGGAGTDYLDVNRRADCDCSTPLVAGYNAIPLAISDWAPNFGTQPTITGLGDGFYRFEWSAGADQREQGVLTYTYGRDVSGWTVDGRGILYEVAAATNMDGIRPYNCAPGCAIPGCRVWAKSVADANAVPAGICANAAYDDDWFRLTLPDWHRTTAGVACSIDIRISQWTYLT